MRAKIKEKREVAKGTLLVVFDLLGERFDYRAGQYFWVELLDPPYQDGKGPRRHISAVTSPTERGVIGLCTRIRDSAFERSLAELPVGVEVEVEPPRGKFVLPDDASRPLVFVAGGIGITAFRSMLRYIQDEGLSHRVTLIYSNRDRESTPFLDELEEIERTNPRVRLILTMTDDDDWSGERRRVDANFFRDYLGNDLNDASYMVAGPPGMAAAATEELKKTGVDEHLISTDSFSGYRLRRTARAERQRCQREEQDGQKAGRAATNPIFSLRDEQRIARRHPCSGECHEAQTWAMATPHLRIR